MAFLRYDLKKSLPLLREGLPIDAEWTDDLHGTPFSTSLDSFKRVFNQLLTG
jgi:hypothetical protein